MLQLKLYLMFFSSEDISHCMLDMMCIHISICTSAICRVDFTWSWSPLGSIFPISDTSCCYQIL